MRTKNILLASAATVLLISCDVNDPIYDTTHPAKGEITLTTEWSDRSEGVAIPDSYLISIGDYREQLSGLRNTLNKLFAPGTYQSHLNNLPQHISVDGTVATVDEVVSANFPDLQFIHNAPEWLFTGRLDITAEADKKSEYTVKMHQQIGRLTLIFDPKGDAANRIEQISGYLTGIAKTFDFENNTYADASEVELVFSKITTGEHSGKWGASVRFLGIISKSQKLYVSVKFKNDNPKSLNMISDLSEILKNFNADKITPLSLEANVIVPDEGGFSAIITDWIPGNGDGESGDAE